MATWQYPTVEGRGGSTKAILLLALAYSLFYLMTLSRSLQGGDSGEFLVVAHRGSVAHPPGYPLYGLLGRAIAWLPLGNPATSVSVLSALCGVAAVVLLFLALRRWGCSLHVSWICAAFFGLTPIFWRYAGVAEVFSLAAALAAALLWLAGREAGPRGLARSGLLGWVLGLGLSNHHTILMLLPVVVLGLFRAHREASRRSWLVPILFLLCLAIGLSPYLTLLGHDSGSGWSWGGSLDLQALVDHFVRKEYGTFSLGPAGQQVGPLDNPLAYLAHLPRSFNLLLPFGLLGLYGLVRSLRHLRQATQAGLDAIAFLLSFFLAALLLPSRFNLDPGEANFVLERFHIQPDLLFVLPCALGLDRLLTAQPRLAIYLKEVAIGVLCGLALSNIPAADWSEDRTVEEYLFNALDVVRPGGVVIGTGDLTLFGFLAVQQVYHHRTDVTYLDLNLIRNRWYHQRIQAQLPRCDLPFDQNHTPVLEIVQALLESHPVYLAGESVPTSVRQRFPLYPQGPLLALLSPEETLPLLPQVEQINRALFARMSLISPPPNRWNIWGRMAYSLYARTWNDIAANYDRLGHSAHAEIVRSFAKRYTVGE